MSDPERPAAPLRSSGTLALGAAPPKFPAIEALLRANRFAEARAEAERAVADQPASGAALRMVYEAAMGQGDYPDAAEAMDRALTLQPDNDYYRRLLATALKDGGRHAEARALLEPMLVATPGSVALLDALVVCRYRTGDEPGALELGQRKLELLDAASPRLDDRPTSPVAPGGRDFVSFSLWGADPRYTIGAMVNARLVGELLPGWSARFALGPDVPQAVVDDLAACGAEIVSDADGAGVSPMMRRFLVHDESGVGRYLSRDTDSRLTSREAGAIAEWVASGRPYHIIRDHPFHHELVHGGLWGGTAGRDFAMRDAIDRFQADHTNDWRYGGDQRFLGAHLHPWVRGRALVHDSYYRLGDSQPLPGGRRGDDGDHIGMGIVGRELLAAEVRRYRLSGVSA